jgi:quercetin dioxygenase-like cupin family protein
MLVYRWQAQRVPDIQQIRNLFEAEGLTPFEETFPSETKIPDHRHPFDEVRTVAEGEVLFDVAGNKLLLRPGDRIIVPSNTRHSFTTQNGPCICVCAQRTT